MNRIRDYLASRTPGSRYRRTPRLALQHARTPACEPLESRCLLSVTPGAVLSVGEHSTNVEPFGTPDRVAVVGDDIYFSEISQGFGGRSLWVRDGETDENRRVGGGFGELGRFTPVGNTLYFTDNDVLSKTDGTSTTTLGTSTGERVVDVAAGNGVAYFTTSSGLWLTNGTDFGTSRLVNASSPRDLTVVNGVAYFLSNGLWRSNGSFGGTTQLNSGQGINADDLLAVAADGTIYFAAGGGLYASNGTAAGTRLVSAVPQNPRELEAMGNAVYFRASDSTRGDELWRSDGTAGGTAPVTDLRPGTPSSSPRQLTAFGGRLYFVATGTVNGAGTGAELWSSDGTEAGTALVKDIVPGTGSPSIGELTNVAGTLYFSAVEASTGRELWRTDGSEAGTVRMHDLYAGAGGSSPREFVAYGTDLVFQALHGVHGEGLFSQPLAAAPGDAPTHLGDMIEGTFSPSFYGGVTPDGRLFFAGGDGSSTGRELFATDGTIANVGLVGDVFPGVTGSAPTEITAVGNTVMFAAEGDRIGRELFKSDGTAGGTGLVKNIWSNSTSFDTADSLPRFLKNVGGTLYFFAWQDSTHQPMWRSDGTANGTVVHSTVGFSPIVVFNGQPLTSLPTTTSERNLAVIGGYVYYAGSTSTGTFPPGDEELWRSDGTTSTRLLDIASGNASSTPSNFTGVGGRVFFTAQHETYGRELWVTDGTTAGTRLVKDILPPAFDHPQPFVLGSRPSGLTNVNGRLVFTAYDGVHGSELWVSDGTEAGTHVLADINPGAGSAVGNTSVLVIGKRMYFTADDGVSGQELWTTDGTAAGTYRVGDLNPGPGSSNPRNFREINGTLVFTANDGTAGVRLYSAELPPPLVASPTGKPDLQPASDTGSSDADNVTRMDNGAAGRELQFLVGDTVPGATVTIYADGVAVGSAVATGTSTLVTTDGVSDLTDGVRSIVARQTEPGGVESANSEPLHVTIDTAVPTVDITDVSPDPRSTGVGSMTIRFSRAVSGFDRADLSLTRDGGPNLLTSSQPLTTSPFFENNIRFTLSNLTSITAIPGTYRLALNASGSNVGDLLAGNALAAGAEDTWVHSPPAWLAPGSAATWNSSNKSLTVTGAATITADPGADSPVITADGASAVLTINPSGGRAVHVGGLTLTGGATATLTSVTAGDPASAVSINASAPAVRGGGGKGNAKPKDKLTSAITATAAAVRTAANSRVLVINGNTFEIDAGSKLDLTDNNLILNYSGASPEADVEGMVKAGFNGGDWLGKRITSSAANANRSFALALSDNARLAIPFDGTRLFAGEAVDSTAVLVKFTHRVDLDLDGVITTNDATIFNSNYSEGGASRWDVGDVDFDGLFTSNDATIFNSFYDESLGAM